jgi:hypothetical protein
LSLEDRLVIDGLEAQPPDLIYSLIELLSREGAGGSDDCEAGAGVECAGLETHANRAISSAIAR